LTGSQLLQTIENYSPDVIGLSVYTFEAPLAYRIVSMVKKSSLNAKIILGGPHPTFMPKEALDNLADFVVVGEGEQTTLELLRAIENGKKPYNIRGIAYQHNDQFVVNPSRDFIKNLDSIPFPARHLLPMDKYTDKLRDGTKAISIMTGRGCPFECVFCNSPQLYRRRVRYHSLNYVISELRECIEKFKVHAFQIVDDTFSLSKKRVIDFCQRLMEEGLNIKWGCLTRPDVVDPHLLSKMKEAGCTNIAYGIESGSECILHLIKKQITVNHVKNAIRLTKMAGIKVEGLFMIGNIGETKDTILETNNLAKELDLDYTSFQLATPFPGTEFRKMANQYGKILPKGWEHYLSDEVTFIPNGLTEKELLEWLHFFVWKTYAKNLLAFIRNFDKFISQTLKDPLHVANVSIRFFKQMVRSKNEVICT
jgi:radical SAM superfamily enzyme YgiQ (UPF0313 family)